MINNSKAISIDIGNTIGIALWHGSRLISANSYIGIEELPELFTNLPTATIIFEAAHFRQRYAKGLYDLGVSTGQILSCVMHKATIQLTRKKIAHTLNLPPNYNKSDMAKAVRTYYTLHPVTDDHVTDAIGVGLAYILSSRMIPPPAAL